MKLIKFCPRFFFRLNPVQDYPRYILSINLSLFITVVSLVLVLFILRNIFLLLFINVALDQQVFTHSAYL